MIGCGPRRHVAKILAKISTVSEERDVGRTYRFWTHEREVRSILILGSNPKMKTELAKELGTTRLDAYNSLSRLQEMGIVTVTADRPMRFSSMNVHQSIEHIIE